MTLVKQGYNLQVIYDDTTLKLSRLITETWGRFFSKKKTLKQLFKQFPKGWLAIAKLKPLSLLVSLLSMPKKAFDNVKIEKWKVKVVSALQ